MRRLLSLTLATGAIFLTALLTARLHAQTPAPNPYVGADACKACHAPYVAAWADTKHARAFGRLGAADREGGQCVRCHVTGSPDTIAAEGAQPSLPGVQCEACHGPGRAHIDAAQSGAAKPGGTVARPPEATCTRCHNRESPHYKPFFYSAMVGLVHRVTR
jgi:hypothetical protein